MTKKVSTVENVCMCTHKLSLIYICIEIQAYDISLESYFLTRTPLWEIAVLSRLR
jgi:hypothetical protein